MWLKKNARKHSIGLNKCFNAERYEHVFTYCGLWRCLYIFLFSKSYPSTTFEFFTARLNPDLKKPKEAALLHWVYFSGPPPLHTHADVLCHIFRDPYARCVIPPISPPTNCDNNKEKYAISLHFGPSAASPVQPRGKRDASRPARVNPR